MGNIKRIIISILFIFMMFSLCACSSNNTEENQGNEANTNIITEETEFYRSIMVADYKGSVDIKRNEGDELSAYEGLSLNDGDEVKVNDHSDLTLNVDSDKHLYADENTHFWITASGSEGNTKTKIKLEKGSVLCQIKNKLLENEFFEIETASSTMSVRGTVYRVTVIKGLKEDEVYELIEVFDGGVATVINEDGQSVELKPGQAALIKEKDDGSDARFVKDDEIDEDFWTSSDMNFNIETEDGNGSPILEISYEKLSEGALEKLAEIVDEGQVVIIEKEVLEEIQETGHNYEVVSRIEPTCTKDGLVVSKCTICNQEMEEVLPKLSHNYVKVSESQATCTSSGLVVYRCSNCSDEKTETIAMSSHNYVQTAHKDPTCTENGNTTFKCTRCGDVTTQAIEKLPHTMQVESIEPYIAPTTTLTEGETTTETLPSYIKGSPIKNSDGTEEVTIKTLMHGLCRACKNKIDSTDDCYLTYDVQNIGNPSTRNLSSVSFENNKKIDESIIGEFKERYLFQDSFSNVILNFLSNTFDYKTVSGLNWIENTDGQSILNYSIGDSADQSRIITLNNVVASREYDDTTKNLGSVNITLIENSNSSLTYIPESNYVLSEEVINSLNVYFLHNLVDHEIIKNVNKLSDNPITVNITYTCCYHDCVYRSHADRTIEKTATISGTNDDKKIYWDDNINVTRQNELDLIIRQLFYNLFNRNEATDYEFDGISDRKVGRILNNIIARYLLDIKETFSIGDEPSIRKSKVYAVYVYDVASQKGNWNIMYHLDIEDNKAIMSKLDETAINDIAKYLTK